MEIKVNEFQTPINDELLRMYPNEVVEWFLDAINNVEILKNMISPDRKRARDLERDEEGKIIVDISNPHILEDMDYFRQPVLHYKKYGCYTFLRQNGNRNSEYWRFWEEEIRRCRDGYVRESDGEWVTGYMYFYLNYCPMMVNEKVKGSNMANRVEGFPNMWEGCYLRFHYLDQARKKGHHAIELARRGASKSYALASIMAHNLILGENSVSKKRCISVLTAYEKEYLSDKDGTLSKFEPMIDFIYTNTPFPRKMLRRSSNDMVWEMGYEVDGIKKGSRNKVIGVSAKDNSDKLRGKRGWILFEEMGAFKGLLELYDVTRKSVEDGDLVFACMYLVGCVCKGTKVWTNDGRSINIEDLVKEDGIVGFADNFVHHGDLIDVFLNRGLSRNPIDGNISIAKKECVEIELSNHNVLRCSEDHPILCQVPRYVNRKFDHYEEVFVKAKNLKPGSRVLELRTISVFGEDKLFDARLVGMLVGDGTYGSGIRYCTEDDELWNYISSKYKISIERSHMTKQNKLYREGYVSGIRKELNNIGILGQTKTNKRLPSNYQTLNENDTKLLLSGLYDTDGTIWIRKNDAFVSITQSNIEILEQIKILWRKFGVIGSITKTNPTIKEGRKDKHPWYNLIISGRRNVLLVKNVLDLLVPKKRDTLNKAYEMYLNKNPRVQCFPEDVIMSKVVSIRNIGEQEVYNMCAGLSHTYLANNIITHNTANNDESDFSSAKTLLYGTTGYNIYATRNVYDKPKQGKDKFGFFFGCAINRADCYNNDGVSDIVKALLQVYMARYKSKYSSDPSSLLRVIAEDPVTPAEAIIKVKTAYFPVTALTERLTQIELDDSFYDGTYIGNIVFENGKPEFRITGDDPIRSYRNVNNPNGAVEIYEMPEKDRNNKVFPNRYLLSCDPFDNDQAESKSLFSVLVLDLWTDRIVAEFTGRRQIADDNYEICRMMCMFFNGKCLYESNKKGLYQYFRKMNSTHMLAETPEFLREKNLVKYQGFGSNAYGVNANAAINNYANSLIKDWLLGANENISYNDDGEEIRERIPRLYTLKNKALIEELIAFNPEINVDRVRSMGMLMLYREQMMVTYQGNVIRTEDDDEEEDEFFKVNYDYKFN